MIEIRWLDTKSVPNWLDAKHGARETLPGNTYVAMLKGDKVAIGAIRLCEGEVCMLDSLATDPKQSSEVREEALTNLVDFLCDRAKELGFKIILSTTREQSVVERSLRHGFKIIPEVLIAKGL